MTYRTTPLGLIRRHTIEILSILFLGTPLLSQWTGATFGRAIAWTGLAAAALFAYRAIGWAKHRGRYVTIDPGMITIGTREGETVVHPREVESIKFGLHRGQGWFELKTAATTHVFDENFADWASLKHDMEQFAAANQLKLS